MMTTTTKIEIQMTESAIFRALDWYGHDQTERELFRHVRRPHFAQALKNMVKRGEITIVACGDENRIALA